MANILMVVSAADSLTMRDGSEHPTGYWAEEVVVSHKNLLDAGHTVRIATPGGMKPTVDQVSLAAESAGGQERADSFREYLALIDAELASPLALADVDASAYDAIVMPGGTGPNTPWFVEDALKEKGAVVENAAAWSSNVVRNGNLITGQNPQSSEDVAKEVINALTK